VREPGIVHWPGKIKPGVTRRIGATYDIFPTALALAGVALPLAADQIDGIDLSSILFPADARGVRARESRDSPGRCVYIYKGTPGLGCPEDHPDCPGLWAIRCSAYKLHFVTSNYTSSNIQVKNIYGSLLCIP